MAQFHLDYTEFGSISDKWSGLDHMVHKIDESSLGFDELVFN